MYRPYSTSSYDYLDDDHDYAFDEEKLRSNGISTSLASFLLYSLSPFLPNPEILDNPDLLADLSTQYRRFMSRRKRLSRLPRNTQGLRKVLRSLAPTCEEVISGINFPGKYRNKEMLFLKNLRCKCVSRFNFLLF